MNGQQKPMYCTHFFFLIIYSQNSKSDRIKTKKKELVQFSQFTFELIASFFVLVVFTHFYNEISWAADTVENQKYSVKRCQYFLFRSIFDILHVPFVYILSFWFVTLQFIVVLSSSLAFKSMSGKHSGTIWSLILCLFREFLNLSI